MGCWLILARCWEFWQYHTGTLDTAVCDDYPIHPQGTWRNAPPPPPPSPPPQHQAAVSQGTTAAVVGVQGRCSRLPHTWRLWTQHSIAAFKANPTSTYILVWYTEAAAVHPTSASGVMLLRVRRSTDWETGRGRGCRTVYTTDYSSSHDPISTAPSVYRYTATDHSINSSPLRSVTPGHACNRRHAKGTSTRSLQALTNAVALALEKQEGVITSSHLCRHGHRCCSPARMPSMLPCHNAPRRHEAVGPREADQSQRKERYGSRR